MGLTLFPNGESTAHIGKDTFVRDTNLMGTESYKSPNSWVLSNPGRGRAISP